MDARPSKTRVNTAGDRLADWWRGVGPGLPDEQLIEEVAVVRAWRRQHDYPLRLTMPSLRNWVDAESSLGINPARRLKRLAHLQDGDSPPELLLYFRMASDVLWLQARGESGDLDFRRRFGAVREQVRPYFQTNA